MRFSVIIPAFNEAENLPRALASIDRAAAGHDVETLVIDNCSTDETPELAKKGGARFISVERKVKISELRNIGARQSQYDHLIFLDADMEVPLNWFAIVTQQFEEPGVDGFGFVEDIPEHAPWYAKIWSRRTLARRATRQRTDFLPGRNICIKRCVFESVNGFSSALTTSEDKDFVMRAVRAGARIYTLPPIGLIHWGYEKTFPEWCRKEYWRQHSHLAMIARHGLSLRILRFPILSFVHLAATVTILMAGLFLSAKWILLLPVVLIPSIIFALSMPESRKTLADVARFSFLYFLRFHIAGAAFLAEAAQSLTIGRRGVS